MNLLNIIKLAKILTKLANIDSDHGPLTLENVEVGAEVFIDGQDGNAIPAPDGAYLIEEGKRKLNVVNGKIESIEEVTTPNADAAVPVNQEETEDENKRKCENAEETAPAEEETKPAEETAPDEKDTKIAELIAKIAELEAEIAEKEAEIEAIKGAPAQTEMNKVQNVSPFKTYKH